MGDQEPPLCRRLITADFHTYLSKAAPHRLFKARAAMNEFFPLTNACRGPFTTNNQTRFQPDCSHSTAVGPSPSFAPPPSISLSLHLVAFCQEIDLIIIFSNWHNLITNCFFYSSVSSSVFGGTS